MQFVSSSNWIRSLNYICVKMMYIIAKKRIIKSVVAQPAIWPQPWLMVSRIPSPLFRTKRPIKRASSRSRTKNGIFYKKKL